MKSMKLFIACMTLTLGTGAFASEYKAFKCSTNLEYKIKDQTKTILLNIYGDRSSRNTLSGQGVFVEVGNIIFTLKMPSTSLSENGIRVKGTNTKEQISLDLQYLENSDGSQNLGNRASVSIKTESGEIVTANNAGHVVCEIEK